MLRGTNIAIFWAALSLIGCVADYEEIDPPVAPALEVVDPGIEDGSDGVSRRPRLTIRLSEPIDPALSNPAGAIRLTSGTLRWYGDVEYSPIQRTIRFEPFDPLDPDTTYELRIRADRLTSIRGAPIDEDVTVRFVTSNEPPDPPDASDPPSYSADVEPIFEAACSCHQQPSVLPSLTYDNLVGVLASDVDRLRVDPFDAARSYLVLKIAPDYPDRLGAQMPPPWSDGPGLTTEELLTIERWVLGGAAP